MAKLTKAELEAKYKLPVYSFWYKVPKGLVTRKMAKKEGIEIPNDATPDAIKGNGTQDYHYPLFKIARFQ